MIDTPSAEKATTTNKPKGAKVTDVVSNGTPSTAKEGTKTPSTKKATTTKPKGTKVTAEIEAWNKKAMENTNTGTDENV